MKTIFMREKDIFPICKGQKVKTARNIKDFPKFKKGEFINLKANHSKPPFATIKILDVYPILDITHQDAKFFKDLGYKTKKEYLNEDFNRRHLTNKRIIIEFEVVSITVNDYLIHFIGWFK